MASSKLDKRANDHSPAIVDPHDEPSAEWGWHGSFPVGMKIAGWLSTAFVLIMLIGNHEGFTEDIWLVAFGVAMAAGLIYHQVRSKTSWRR
ncbi:DUF2631 domain-containing protein [Umezawaea beigongshangensis]|uniref:DUF2631 domain-containing protein n=1 Tax=Umezawaea beigongshangensis TaxID=2780383 RepID=UPI0018F1FE87|nr:DUF2631 domain-containing protein [Umezawaea beigongshangensis]